MKIKYADRWSNTRFRRSRRVISVSISIVFYFLVVISVSAYLFNSKSTVVNEILLIKYADRRSNTKFCRSRTVISVSVSIVFYLLMLISVSAYLFNSKATAVNEISLIKVKYTDQVRWSLIKYEISQIKKSRLCKHFKTFSLKKKCMMKLNRKHSLSIS